MPSFQDSAVIFVLALLLFGPKKLPELARQLGKLMGEFRRASNEFRMQMEDELRVAEQEDRKQKIAAIDAAAPKTPAIAAEPSALLAENRIAPPADAPEPQPIASAGDLHLMPPATGLPVARSSTSTDLEPAFSSIPQAPAESFPAPPDRYHHLAPPADSAETLATAETTQHG